MIRSLIGLAFLGSAAAAGAATPSSPMPASTATDFGVRVVGGGSAAPAAASTQVFAPLRSGAINLSAVASIGAQWGRVTSTYRSPERNRRVGGVRNSFHLSGRAIDIARRPGVRHRDIEAAYRAAGYQLIESLDEGDHSHFAFGTRPRANAFASLQPPPEKPVAATQFRIVSAPTALRR